MVNIKLVNGEKKMRWLRAHLDSVDESYWQHMAVSLWFFLMLFIASAACLLHAIFPFMLTDTGTNHVAKVVKRILAGKRRQGFLKKIGVDLPFK